MNFMKSAINPSVLVQKLCFKTLLKAHGEGHPNPNPTCALPVPVTHMGYPTCAIAWITMSVVKGFWPFKSRHGQWCCWQMNSRLIQSPCGSIWWKRLLGGRVVNRCSWWRKYKSECPWRAVACQPVGGEGAVGITSIHSSSVSDFQCFMCVFMWSLFPQISVALAMAGIVLRLIKRLQLG